MLTDESFGFVVETHGELVFQPYSAQQPQRVVLEDPRADGAKHAALQILYSPVRVDGLAAGQRPRDSVDREVARCEVRLDPVGKWREVHGAIVGERDPPSAVPVGEWKRRAAGLPREPSRRRLRLPTGDVEVDDRSSEQLVSHGPADDPRLLARQARPEPAQASRTVRRRPGRPVTRFGRRSRS